MNSRKCCCVLSVDGNHEQTNLIFYSCVFYYSKMTGFIQCFMLPLIHTVNWISWCTLLEHVYSNQKYLYVIMWYLQFESCTETQIFWGLRAPYIHNQSIQSFCHVSHWMHLVGCSCYLIVSLSIWCKCKSPIEIPLEGKKIIEQLCYSLAVNYENRDVLENSTVTLK